MYIVYNLGHGPIFIHQYEFHIITVGGIMNILSKTKNDVKATHKYN